MRKITPSNALKIAEKNPYKGTSAQITKLAITIAQLSSSVDDSVFALYKDEVGISPKIFSKLKVRKSTSYSN